MDTSNPPGSSPEAERCRLLGPTGLVVQAIMGALVIVSLVIKRQLEKRKRPWRIWMWDVGKQLVGQAVVHMLNLLISDTIANAANNNPCSLYFLNVLIDTTIGVLIFYLALKSFTYLCTVRFGLEGFISGQYGTPPQPRFWWRQLFPYIGSIITMKLLVLLPLTLPVISPALLRLGHALLDWFAPDVQVVFVMAIFPLVMNIVQFCVVDQVIKAGQEPATETGYSRVDDEDDLETGHAAGDDGVPQKSTSGHSMPPSPLAPHSPLLTSVDPGSRSPAKQADYGATSPSPSPSDLGVPAHSAGVWARLSVGTSSAASTDGSESTITAGEDHGRFRRRSNAPSPESLRAGPERDTHSSRNPSPPPTLMTSSRLSEDLSKAAAHFSPKASPILPSSRFEDDVNMSVVR